MNIEAYAKKQGYYAVRKIGQWKGYDVYEALLEDDDLIVGIPAFVLCHDGKMRMSTVDESFKIMDFFM